MLKAKMKSAIIAALTVAMVACIALAGYALANNADLVYAKTAEQQATTRFEATDVTVSADKPLTLKLTGVAAGQYYLTVTVKNETLPEFFYSEFIATVGEEARYLAYNPDEKTAAGVIKTANAGDELVLSVTSETELTVDVSVEDLFIGPETDNTLGVVELEQNVPVKIDLENITSGSYSVYVDIGLQRLAEDSTITLGVNGGENIDGEHNDTDFARTYFWNNRDLTDGGYITITSTDAQTVEATVRIVSSAYPELPTEKAETLTPWELVTYSYESAAAGTYSISYTATPDAEVSITFKTTAESYDGLLVQGNNYPLVMEEGTYYFDVVLYGDSSADVKFTIKPWVAPTFTVDQLTYVPVIPTGAAIQKFALELAAGTYTLTLTDLPQPYFWDDVDVTAYFEGESEDDKFAVVLTAADEYSLNVDITTQKTVYFITSSIESSVIGVTFATPEVRNEISEGVPTQVTIPVKGEWEDYGAAIYYVNGAAVGNYYLLTLSNVSDGDYVSVITSEGIAPFIAEGGTVGAFRVFYEGDFAIIFRNSGDSEVTLTAQLSNVLGDSALALNTAATVEASANSSATKYIEGLVQGSYNLIFSDAENITLYADGVELPITDNRAVLTVNNAQAYNGIVSFVFVNGNSSAKTFTFTVSPANEMALDTPITINAQGYETVTSYYITLSAGTYAMALDLPEGLSVNVVLGGNEVVAYGNVSGTVTVAENSYLPVTFYCYADSEAAYTFKAVLYSVTESMSVGSVKHVVVGTSVFAKTYSIELSAGEYKINLYDGLKIAVNGVVVGEDGTFAVTAYSSSAYITFINTGDSEINDYNATIELVNSYVLTLGVNKTLTLGLYEGISNYINLAAGTYYIKLDVAGAQIYVNGLLVVDYNQTSGSFTIEEAAVTEISIYNYYSDDAITFTYAVAGSLSLEESTDISLSESENSKTYYLNLSAGNYEINLYLASGVEIQVQLNGTVIINYGENSATFTIEAAEGSDSVAAFFVFTYNGTGTVDFSVDIFAD